MCVWVHSFSLSLQIVFHDVTVLGVVLAIGWGFFSALVAMTCTHDARYIHTYIHTCVSLTLSLSMSPSLSHTQPFFHHTQAVGVEDCGFFYARLLPRSLHDCLAQSGGGVPAR